MDDALLRSYQSLQRETTRGWKAKGCAARGVTTTRTQRTSGDPGTSSRVKVANLLPLGTPRERIIRDRLVGIAVHREDGLERRDRLTNQVTDR